MRFFGEVEGFLGGGGGEEEIGEGLALRGELFVVRDGEEDGDVGAAAGDELGSVGGGEVNELGELVFGVGEGPLHS